MSMSEAGIKTVRASIAGRVQGVWFRGWTVDRARELGLSGWVRNRRDGTVEALFSGLAGSVDAMLKRCREGPSAARVVSVETGPGEPPGEAGFRQLPTA